MAYYMDEDHAAKLRTLLKLEEDADLPQDVVDLYWEFERCCRRLGCPICDRELIQLVMMLGKQAPADPVTFLDTIKEEGVKRGDLVLAKFRNKWVPGQFVRTKAKKIVVLLDDGNAEEREFSALSVRLPVKEELEKLQA